MAPALFQRWEKEENRVFGSGAFGLSRDMSLSWNTPPPRRPGDHALPEWGESHVGHSRSLALGEEAAGDPRLPGPCQLTTLPRLILTIPWEVQSCPQLVHFYGVRQISPERVRHLPEVTQWQNWDQPTGICLRQPSPSPDPQP